MSLLWLINSYYINKCFVFWKIGSAISAGVWLTESCGYFIGGDYLVKLFWYTNCLIWHKLVPIALLHTESTRVSEKLTITLVSVIFIATAKAWPREHKWMFLLLSCCIDKVWFQNTTLGSTDTNVLLSFHHSLCVIVCSGVQSCRGWWFKQTTSINPSVSDLSTVISTRNMWLSEYFEHSLARSHLTLRSDITLGNILLFLVEWLIKLLR